MFDIKDDEPKTEAKPEKKEDKQPFSINGNMNQLIIIGAILIGFFLFKDEIMGIVNEVTSGFGGGGGGGGGAPATEETETEAAPEGGGAEGEEMGGAMRGRRGKKRGRGRRGGRRKMRRQMRDKAIQEAYYVGIANAGVHV